MAVIPPKTFGAMFPVHVNDSLPPGSLYLGVPPPQLPAIIAYKDWRFMSPLGEVPARVEVVMTYADGKQEVVSFAGGHVELKFHQTMYSHGAEALVSGYGPPSLEKRESDQCVLPTGCLMRCHVREDEDGK